MGAAIALRGDFDGPGLRRLAKSSKDAGQSRRLLALAEIYDGGARSDAARMSGVGLQVIRDWVLRLNVDGPDGLIDRKASGPAPKLDDAQRRALAHLVENGPIPATHGVVRWRLKDLAQWILEEFRISLDETTVGRELKALGFVKISARPISSMRKTNWPSRILKKRGSRRVGGDPSRCSRPIAEIDPVVGRTKRGSARKTRSPGAGRHGEPGPGRPGTNARSQPISSAPSVRRAASGRPSSCPAATPRPCNGIWMKSRPRSAQAPTPSSSPTRPGGIPRPSSRSRPTSRFCSCRQGRPS